MVELLLCSTMDKNNPSVTCVQTQILTVASVLY